MPALKRSNPQLKKSLLTLCLIAISGLILLGPSPSHSVITSYSVNAFGNPGFESGLSGWRTEFFDANVGSTIGVDCTRAVAGSCSAELDIGQSDTRLSNQSQTITFGHISLYQILPPNTLFSNLTDRADGLNLWFHVQPKFSGYTLVQVRFKATSTIEMDYVFTSPTLGSGFSNSTDGGEAGKPVKFFVLPNPVLYQWNHLTRNVRQDWQSQMKYTNSTGSTVYFPGFQLNETLFRVELEAYYYKDTANVYGETVWGDEMRLYMDSNSPPTSTDPPDPIHFPTINFQDRTETPLDGTITWTVFNLLGLQVNPAPGELVPATGYTLKAYYDGYMLYSAPVTSTTYSPIQLQMFPLYPSKTSYLAFNSTVSILSITQNDAAGITFSADSQAPSLVIVNVPTKPLFVEKNGQRISSWTYNSTSQTIAINTDSLGTFSIIFSTPPNGSTLPYVLATGAGGVIATILGFFIWRRRSDRKSSLGGEVAQTAASKPTSTTKETLESYPRGILARA